MVDKNITENYEKAFQNLSNSHEENNNHVPESWYKDEATNTVGLIWHFTDINNMANILSYMQIKAKNLAIKDGLVENDNASEKINSKLTKPWVHDYARFYFRPKTPTQYRNEGIFEKHLAGESINHRLLNKKGKIWTDDKPAHLPVPVFICFSLKKALNKGGFITKQSLAGRNTPNNISQILDMNLENFKNNVLHIYRERGSENCEKQTEFIIKNSLNFEPNDIIKIIVRSEAEKLALLTMLEEHNAKLFSDKEQHQKIDIAKYINKIIVDDTVFFNDAGRLIMVNEKPKGENLYSKLLKDINPKNSQILINNYVYDKKISDSDEVAHVTVDNLKRQIIKVTDINNEEKTVGIFHDPDWILNTQKWRNIRYYSNIYYHKKYLQLWRKIDEDFWHIKNTDRLADLDEKSSQILKKVEESYHIQYEEKIDQ